MDGLPVCRQGGERAYRNAAEHDGGAGPGYITRKRHHLSCPATTGACISRVVPGGQHHLQQEDYGATAPVCRCAVSTQFGCRQVGSGKTTAAFRILASAHENGVKCLVLDWKNEYRSLVRHHTMGPELRVFTVGKADVSPLRFNPLIPPRNTSASTHCKHVIDMVMTAYYLGEGVAHLFQVAIDALYKEFRVYDGFPEQYPTFADVAHYLSDYKPRNQREAGWLSSAVRSLSVLTFGEMGQVVVTNDPLPMDELLSQDTVIEMDVSAADKAFIVQALLWNIYTHCAGRQEGNAGLTNLIVLEEAHNILRKSVASAKETIPEILLRQARSRGIGLIVVDQTISLLSPAVLGNIHNLICLSQPPSSTATNMLNLPEDGKDYTGRLEVGEAIVKIQSRFQAPFTVRFPMNASQRLCITARTTT
ncbi:MAG: ATP-binding protein [Lentisphaerae bacterium]|nr:ATP-binding protein [Lentisphaerota bacterium]